MKQLLEFLVKQPVQHQEISYVTWSSKGIRVVYSDSMVAHLTAEDMYPLAVPPELCTGPFGTPGKPVLQQ